MTICHYKPCTGQVDFTIGLVNSSVHNLPDRKEKFFGGIQITEELHFMFVISG